MSVDQLNRLIRRLPTWVVYLLGALPLPYLFYQGLTGALGVDPVKAIEHRYGALALQFLLASLAVTPLRRHLGLNLMKFRRALGLLCFYYVSGHLLVWLVLDVQIPREIITDILKRPYITIGMAGFALLLPLALTSNSYSIRRLGARWRLLHRGSYLAVLLGGIHYVWLAKGIQLEPVLYLLAACLLLLSRVKRAKLRILLFWTAQTE